jgi:hypothetical protein
MRYRLCLLAVGIPERALFGARPDPSGAWRHDVDPFDDEAFGEKVTRKAEGYCPSPEASRTRGAPAS